ncbi:hypothetical protein GQ55_9G106200 [Panicum hallii var. hallii]|uniref:Uncharacterized protein n=1 Tax=Panicum hallii var. hallii TaxID=1504633 RepID=A0A2T7C1Q9_9POAL|nr:hypothetical protein GQ55_9G106200 [Panicum hallii var. hallii]
MNEAAGGTESASLGQPARSRSIMLHVPLRRPCAGPSADPPPLRRAVAPSCRRRCPAAPPPPSRRRPPRFRPRRRVSHLRRTVFVSSDSDLVSDHEVSRHPLTSLPGPRMWCLSARLRPHDPSILFALKMS